MPHVHVHVHVHVATGVAGRVATVRRGPRSGHRHRAVRGGSHLHTQRLVPPGELPSYRPLAAALHHTTTTTTLLHYDYHYYHYYRHYY